VWAGRFLGIALFTVLLLAVVALAALVVPEGKVTLAPYRQPIEVVLDLRADPAVEVSSLEGLTIPARIVQAQVEETGEIATINKKDAPDEPATGTVIFTNQTAQTLDIPLGTIVRTSTGTTVRFKTVADATLEGRIGATAQVDIEALDSGPVGNVPAATITTVETSSLRTNVRVTNESATRGGGVKQVGVVTRADMDRLKAQLLQQLQDRAYAELLIQLKEGEFLPEASLTVEIMAEVYDQFLDAEADTLHLQMRILASSTAVNQANANGLAYEALKDRIPAGYDLESEDIAFTLDQKQARMEGQSVLVQVKAIAYLVTAVDRGQIRSAVAGLPPEEAERVLADSFTLGGAPQVEIQPEWIKRFKLLNRVPWVPFRIQVVVLE
jgi:hypothetical protein